MSGHALSPGVVPLEGAARAALETHGARFPVALGERYAAKLGLTARRRTTRRSSMTCSA